MLVVAVNASRGEVLCEDEYIRSVCQSCRTTRNGFRSVVQCFPKAQDNLVSHGETQTSHSSEAAPPQLGDLG